MSTKKFWQTKDGLAGETVTGNGRHHILIAHGSMVSRAYDDAILLPDWRNIPDIASLSRYDSRGHGQSIKDRDPAAYHWARAGDDLLSCYQHLAHKPTILIGSSMGTAAVLYAATQPGIQEKLSALILTIPPTSGPVRDPLRPIMRRWADHLRAQGAKSFVDYLYAQPPTPLFARDYPNIRDIGRPLLEQHDANALAASLEGAAQSDWPDDEILRGLNVPCLILCRDMDATHPVAMGEKLSSLLPNSHLIISPDCAAISQWPDDVGSFLRDFF